MLFSQRHGSASYRPWRDRHYLPAILLGSFQSGDWLWLAGHLDAISRLTPKLTFIWISSLIWSQNHPKESTGIFSPNFYDGKIEIYWKVEETVRCVPVSNTQHLASAAVYSLSFFSFVCLFVEIQHLQVHCRLLYASPLKASTCISYQ